MPSSLAALTARVGPFGRAPAKRLHVALVLGLRLHLRHRFTGFLSQAELRSTYGCGSKLTRRGYASFGSCFHLPGFHFGTGFLSHTHMAMAQNHVPKWHFGK